MTTGESPPSCRSICTSCTPSMVLSSSVTALTQCPHVMPCTMMSVRAMVSPSSISGGSAAHQARDGVGRLAHLLLGSFVGFAGRVDDAVPDVIFEQAEAHRLQRLGDRADLGEHVDAVGVFLDHPLDAANLPLDPPQPLEVVVLGAGVTSHVGASNVRCVSTGRRVPLPSYSCNDYTPPGYSLARPVGRPRHHHREDNIVPTGPGNGLCARWFPCPLEFFLSSRRTGHEPRAPGCPGQPCRNFTSCGASPTYVAGVSRRKRSSTVLGRPSPRTNSRRSASLIRRPRVSSLSRS